MRHRLLQPWSKPLGRSKFNLLLINGSNASRVAYAPRVITISFLTGIDYIRISSWSEHELHLYLALRIILGGEGESTCESQPDDRFSTRFGLSRHFLGRKYSRLHNLPLARIHTNISRARRKHTVIAVWSYLDHHQISLAWNYVAHCRKRYPWHHTDPKVAQFLPFQESRSGSKLEYCCEKVQSTYEKLYGPSSWELYQCL